MFENNIESELKTLVRKIVELPKNTEINLKTDFRNDLGYDSLDAVELIMAVEKKYNISITDEELEKVFTFKDLIRKVEEKLKND